MKYDNNGYGELENRIIELFRSGAPDYEAAEELIRQGADLNATGMDDDKNVLSEILSFYWCSKFGDDFKDSDDRESNDDLNPDLGPSLCGVIRFFLDHGFDVTKRDGCFGAQCLHALAESIFDRYIIEATKLLMGAGAKNRTISPSSTDEDTPWNAIGFEGSFKDNDEYDHSTGNIYEAVYQIYQAIADGRPYAGIDSYEIAIGRKILRVLAEDSAERPVFYSMTLPEFQKDNCYTDKLYFVYDGGVLVTTQFADFWTDTFLPATGLIDVSEHFEGIVGNTITNFAYGHKDIVKGIQHYGQPITNIEMDSGQKIRFTINYGQVKDEDRVAYYELFR